MVEPFTVRVRWSAELEMQANERFLQSVTRAQRCIHYIGVAFMLIAIPLFAYAAIRGYCVAACFMLLTGLGAIVELVWRPRFVRAMAAHRLRMADQGGEAEWAFTPDWIEYQFGHQPLRLKWKLLRVTRFPDGFLLVVPTLWLRYWLPADTFSDSAIDAFEKLAQKAAARYRTASAGPEPGFEPDRRQL